jgi:hypothetical protein
MQADGGSVSFGANTALTGFSITTNSATVNGTAPRWYLNETGAGTDLKRWAFLASAGVLLLRIYDDAISNSANWGRVLRSGTGAGITVDEVEFNSTLFDGNFTTFDIAGNVVTPNTSASEVGFKGVPRTSKTADYTIAAADSGTELVCTSAADDITVQATGAPVAGSVVFIENGTGGSLDIIQGSGMTLTLDGTATTGSRTLAAAGRAYVRFTSSSAAAVGGIGVA